jgi:type IV pilus assembly protein PilA
LLTDGDESQKKQEEDFMRLKKGRKGFTLVELIVVLVILAILAALLVPALTGYIDKAKEKVL